MLATFPSDSASDSVFGGGSGTRDATVMSRGGELRRASSIGTGSEAAVAVVSSSSADGVTMGNGPLLARVGSGAPTVEMDEAAECTCPCLWVESSVPSRDETFSSMVRKTPRKSLRKGSVVLSAISDTGAPCNVSQNRMNSPELLTSEAE